MSAKASQADEEQTAYIAELIEFVDNSAMVGEWNAAENFYGVVIEEAMAFDPEMLPDGWKVGSISGSNVHIVTE